MTESREVLDALREVLTSVSASGRTVSDPSRAALYVVEWLQAHPVAVLDLLESAPCQMCGGRGKHEHIDPLPGERLYTCSACGGSGRLGRDGVLRALGMEQVGWAQALDSGPSEWVWGYAITDRKNASGWAVPVFARVAVPEPSEGE